MTIIIKVVLICCICTLLLSTCSEREGYSEVKEKEISDPYVMSFWGRSIHYMLREAPLEGYDTTTFDSLGNMVKIQTNDRTIQKEFAKNQYLTRHLIKGHAPEHNIIQYDTAADIIIQKWVRVMTFTWDYTSEDVNQLKAFYTVFFFNEKNQLLKEVNLKDSFVASYEYEGSILVKKNRYDLTTKALSGTWKYFYEKGKIKKIEEYYYGAHHNIPSNIHYFNDGQLDSTQYLNPQKRVVRTQNYKYVFW